MDEDHKFMEAEADAAREHIELLTHAMSKLTLKYHCDRVRIAAQLARASIDFGRGMTVLMANGFMDLGAPAISLHRIQMEHLMRAAFFSGPATEAELDYFIRENSLKRRPRANRRDKRPMTMNELAAIVEPYLDQDDVSGKLTNAVKGSYGTLSILMHGGHALLHAYGGNSDEVGFSISRENACQMLDHVVAFANLALAVVARVSEDDPEKLSDVLGMPFKSFEAWVERMRRR